MNVMHKLFDSAHNNLVSEIQNADEASLDIQPEGFGNNIHWHAGHVLTINEMLLFGFPDQSSHLPDNYNDLFGNGSSPADWPENVPSVKELTNQLQDQLERMKQIPESQFNNKLDKPILGAETFGELAAVAMTHESNHTGRINAIKKAIAK
ncbi:bacillithiol transferase BstA [Lentibacillus halophilus]|uniref:Bacillithiol transferase BstA n=1 Tax=Lentibacillus halophilus TaxID=295065 RepID=A0ABP3J1P6_9BACI